MKTGMKIGVGLVAIFMISFYSCQTLMKNTEVNVQYIAHERFDHDLYKLFIKFRFNQGSNPDTILALINHSDSLASFYARRDYKPIWTRNMLNHSVIDTITYYFRHAGDHGLQENSYHTRLIDKCLENYMSSIQKDTSINYLALANLELLLSDAILTYRNHLLYGAIDPTETDPEAYHLPLDRPDSANFFDPLTSRDIVKYLEDIQPKEEAYINMQQALANYRDLQVRGGWRSLDIVFNKDEKIEPGDTAYFLDKIAERLKITVELNASYTPELAVLDSFMYEQFIKRDFLDSNSNEENITYYVYNTELIEAIKTFQSRNGLFVDGVVGNNTISKLNIPIEDRINQICLNLERLRWFNYPEDSKFILVNIPDFRLFVIDKGKKQIEMKVCVGKKRDSNYAEKLEIFSKTRNRNYYPNNNETPLLHGNIDYFVLNPKWNVPENIGKNEIFHKVLTDPEYLSKRNFKVYFNGSEVSTDSIDWTTYNADRLPFRFQQDASSGNALGKIKFIFENNYSIYLHDTPSKQAFGYTNRALSHGCIRLEKPVELANFLANDIDGLSEEDINSAIYGSKDKSSKAQVSRTIFLKEQVPLFINYFTSWVDEEGNLQFRDDVYGKDALLLSEAI